MTKFDLMILLVLNDNNVDNSSKALSISQILSHIEDVQRRSYSTTYRHLCNMAERGYVKCGLVDALASTYYLTDTGKIFCNTQD